MTRLSIKMYHKRRERTEVVLKTDSKTLRIKHLENRTALLGKLKAFGAAVESGARIQGMFTIRDSQGGVWLLDCDARTDEARMQLWIADFVWHGSLTALKKAIRLL